ncbi:hypothetical protein C5167_008388 [Papaver somniferum]|uniref:Uncharacterized protein n=1 Tax=Papaver somniferum TaxID=3469 RepID=A0A4Y7JXC8_PAPSO|nr:hypothetical protein C5167_008388 [Papaver somniferum]
MAKSFPITKIFSMVSLLLLILMMASSDIVASCTIEMPSSESIGRHAVPVNRKAKGIHCSHRSELPPGNGGEFFKPDHNVHG